MRPRSIIVVSGLSLVAALFAAIPSVAGGRPLSASLKGASEVPGPGDPDGTGSISLTVNPGQRQICYTIKVSGIALPATAAHIHAGTMKVAGPVLVTLTAPGASGTSSGCVTLSSRELARSILQHPANYYVNVHTVDFSSGALRGQLGTGSGGGTSSPNLTASLRGTGVIPGPGDPDGTGTARLTLMPDVGEICYETSVSLITLPAVGAMIHSGAPGVVGPVVATLGPPGVSGTVSGCVVGLDHALLGAMMANPSLYYVDVTTFDFPGGALRGQLAWGGGGGGGGLGGTKLSTGLRGRNEVPGSGDLDGTGQATITLVPSQGEVCFDLSVSGLALPATAAHIHFGSAGVAGPVVVTLSPPDWSGHASGCLFGVDPSLVSAIGQDPARYYVNVHTVDFPNGAVRGQLCGGGGGEDRQGDEDDDEGNCGRNEDRPL